MITTRTAAPATTAEIPISVEVRDQKAGVETTRVDEFVALSPIWSVTRTDTTYVPVAFVEQDIEAVLGAGQEGGSPDQRYEYGGKPPEVCARNVAGDPGPTEVGVTLRFTESGDATISLK